MWVGLNNKTKYLDRQNKDLMFKFMYFIIYGNGQDLGMLKGRGNRKWAFS